jgi:hypothetical protein
MVSPRDFARPYNPMGGGTVEGDNPDIRRAMAAAQRTAAHFDRLLMVTDDGTTQWYGGGDRHLSVQYQAILEAMEAPPVPDRPAEVEARITAARAVLYQDDFEETPAYRRYLDNQQAYADAKRDFIIEQNAILADPDQAASAPLLLTAVQTKVDQAYRRWKSQGAHEIESALATLNSIGVPLEQGMIDRARQRLEAWTFNLAGIAGPDAVKEPYTYLTPGEWAEIDADDVGWTTVKRVQRRYESYFRQHGYGLSTGDWGGSASGWSGSIGPSIFGFGFSGTYSRSSSQSHQSFSTTATDGTEMGSDATDLSVELQYGLCRINRRWLVPDLFHLRNWYLRGARKGAVSDGTVKNQVDDRDRRLPMIPTHVLVVRNVRITAVGWGEARNTLESYWSRHDASQRASSSSVGGGVSIPVWGPIALTGGYSRNDSRYQGDFKDESGRDVRDDWGAYFEEDTLMVNGAQIVGWLGEILPFSAPMDDPTLPAGNALPADPVEG